MQQTLTSTPHQGRRTIPFKAKAAVRRVRRSVDRPPVLRFQTCSETGLERPAARAQSGRRGGPVSAGTDTRGSRNTRWRAKRAPPNIPTRPLSVCERDQQSNLLRSVKINPPNLGRSPGEIRQFRGKRQSRGVIFVRGSTWLQRQVMSLPAGRSFRTCQTQFPLSGTQL
jgi:hypothetical protein